MLLKKLHNTLFIYIKILVLFFQQLKQFNIFTHRFHYQYSTPISKSHVMSTPHKCSEVNPKLVERSCYGRRDVLKPQVNWGGNEACCPTPAAGTSQGTYVTPSRGQQSQGTYGQEACPSTSNGQGMYGIPSTSYGTPTVGGHESCGVPLTQGSEQAELAAEVLVKFQESCDIMLNQLKTIAASAPSSGRSSCSGASNSSPGSGGAYGLSTSPIYYSSPGGTSGYSASASSPGSGGGFSPPHPSHYPRRPPPPPRGKSAGSHRSCPAETPGPGETNLVKPNLENILNVVQFGLGRFLEIRNTHFIMLKCVFEMNQTRLDEGMMVLQEVEKVMVSDLGTLPDFINMWGQHAKYLQDQYQLSINSQNPTPNLNLVDHPSACVTQHAYSELLSSAANLCLEVERGLRLTEIMYSKLDETVQIATKEMLCAYNRLCTTEETRKSLAAEVQEWSRRFRETQHAVNNFLSEWKKGGENLNKPFPEICAPNIPNEEDYEAYDPKLNPDTFTSQCSSSAPTSDLSPSSGDSSEVRRLVNIGRLVKELDNKKEGLASLIDRFNNMNTSLHLEVQQNMDQQEVLNESLRAMDDLSPSPEHPRAPQNSPA